MEKLIISEDAVNLIESLKCYWQIDNMNRTYTFRELRIELIEHLPQAEEEESKSLGLVATKHNPAHNLPVEKNYVWHLQKDYKFALRRDF